MILPPPPWKPRIEVIAGVGESSLSGRVIRADLPRLDWRTSGAVCLAIASDPNRDRADHLMRLSRALAGGHLDPGRLSVYDLRYWLTHQRTRAPHVRHVLGLETIPGYTGEKASRAEVSGDRIAQLIEADMSAWIEGRRVAYEEAGRISSRLASLTQAKARLSWTVKKNSARDKLIKKGKSSALSADERRDRKILMRTLRQEAARRSFVAGLDKSDDQFDSLAAVNPPRLLDGDTLIDHSASPTVSIAVPSLCRAGWIVQYDGVKYVAEYSEIAEADTGEILDIEEERRRFEIPHIEIKQTRQEHRQ